MEVLNFRFRADASVGLNEDEGWAALENIIPGLVYDRPFRLRLQVGGRSGPALGQIVRLQYRKAQG
ncbi:MAG: hypothetical protein V2I82_01520, partial [Halieaceae bacterium]|nr:hypothetical protein [Halieaceae bacterium]